MATVKMYGIRCNGCGRWGPNAYHHRDAVDARREAKRAGWKRIPRGTEGHYAGADLCPGCGKDH